MNTIRRNTAYQALLSGLCLATMTSIGCGRTADLDIDIVEPCTQTGVVSESANQFELDVARMSEETGEIEEILKTSSFKSGTNLPSTSFELGQTILLRVQGFADDDTTQTPSIVGASATLQAERDEGATTMMIGRSNSFERATAVIDNEIVCSDTAAVQRFGHSATYVPSINKVIVFGGASWVPAPGTEVSGNPHCKSFGTGDGQVYCMEFVDTVGVYDTVTGEFTEVPTNSSIGKRAFHSASLFTKADGTEGLLLAGGFGLVSQQLQALKTGALIDLERINDGTFEFENIVLAEARAMHTSEFLSSQGKVLLLGGCSGGGCTPDGLGTAGATDLNTSGQTAMIEMYDVETGIVSTMLLDEETAAAFARSHHASSVADGRIIVSGGVFYDSSSRGARCDIQVIGVSSQTNQLEVLTDRVAEETRSMGDYCPMLHAQVTIPGDNQSAEIVMISGGYTNLTEDPTVATNPANISNQIMYRSASNTHENLESNATTLRSARARHQAIRLWNGKVLVFGGTLASANGSVITELLQRDPSAPRIDNVDIPASLPQSPALASAAVTGNNQVFSFGGYFDVDGSTSARAQIFLTAP